jgi:hypothetical protein
VAVRSEGSTERGSLLTWLNRHPRGADDGAEPAVEFSIDPAKFHDAFAADLPEEQAAVMAATQRPVAELAFSEPPEAPAWKRWPSWAIVAAADKAAGTDVTRSMAKRAGSAITEVEGSHVIMVLRPQAVVHVIFEAVAAAISSSGVSWAEAVSEAYVTE